MQNPLPGVKSIPDNRPPARLAPPLWVWAVTGVGAFVGFILLLVMALWSEEQLSQQFTKDAETLLRREWALRSDSVTRVVVLGTSLVEYGVADREFFEQRCGKRARVVKLFREAVNIDAFTEESLIFQLLGRYPPDILCIEENLLLFRMPHSLRPSLAERVLEPINRHLWIRAKPLKLKAGWATPRQDSQLFQGFPHEQHQLNQQDTLHLSAVLAEIRSRKVRNPTELPALYGSLQHLRQRGTRLVMLHLPRPADLEAIIRGEGRAPLLRDLTAYYQERYQVDYWHYNQPMPFRYFTDQAHLNHLGNPVYSAWLANQICPLNLPSPK